MSPHFFTLFTLLVLLFPRVYAGSFGSARETIVCLFTVHTYSVRVNMPIFVNVGMCWRAFKPFVKKQGPGSVSSAKQ